MRIFRAFPRLLFKEIKPYNIFVTRALGRQVGHSVQVVSMAVKEDSNMCVWLLRMPTSATDKQQQESNMWKL